MAYTSPFDVPDDDPEFQAFKTQFLGSGQKQNSGFAGDVGTGLKIGVEQLPGMVTGLADIAAAPISKMTGLNKPFSKAAYWLGEQTGFQPEAWAKKAQSEYSPQYQEAKHNVDAAEGFWGTTGALLKNPRVVAGTVAESLPSTVAGMGVAGFGARAALGAERFAALRTAAAAGDKAALGQLTKYGSIAGGIGEGTVTAGQQMSQLGDNVDPLVAAGTSLGAGTVTGVIGGMSGRLASKMGLSDIDSALVTGIGNKTGQAGIGGIAKRAAQGALTEGVIEELPQSMQEQIWQNVAEGKPWNEGVAKQGAMGMMAGMAMGAGINMAPRREPQPVETPQAEEKAPVNLLGHNPEIGTSWNNTYNYDPIIAEGSASQVPLQQLDLLHLGDQMTEARELMHSDMSQRRQDALYDMPEFNLNDQTLPLPTDPGSAVAVIQVLSHAAERGQALVEGTAAHEALVEAQRILAENGLSFISAKAPTIAKGASNAVSQVAQGSNQVQGGNPVGSTGTVGLGNSATGQRDGLGRTAIAPAGPSGTTGAVESAGGGVGAVNPATAGFSKKQLAAWNDAVEKLGEGHPALESISDAIAKNKLPVAQKALTEALAPAKIESLSEVKLPKVQQKVFDYMLTAARENNLDAVVDSEGTFKSTEIAEALGLKKGSALAAITGAQKHLATQLGFGSVEELKTFLKNRTSEVRTTQESDAANLGMSPAVQNNQVVNDADLFGNSEAGTEQNMGIINSVGGSQGETEGLRDGHRDRDLNDENLRILRKADRTKNDAASSNVQTAEEVAREERIKAEAKARADAQNKAVLATNEAKTAAVDWGEFKSNTAPNFSDLTEQAQASWVVQYVETVSNDSSNEAIESAQRDFERQLESTDVRSETQGSQNGPAAELGRTSEGGQGTLAAPVQKAEPAVTTKKRRIAKPEEGVGGKTQFSESEGRKATVNNKVLSWAQQVLVRRAKDAVVAIVTTPNAILKQVGIYRSITLDIEHAGHIMQTHPEIRPEDLAALSDLLQRPRAVILHGTGFNFIVDARDGAGKPLLVALNNTTLKGGGQALKVTGVSTMFGMDDSAASLVRNLQAGNVKFLAQKEVARLQGLMSLGETPRNTETSGATNRDQDLRYEGSIPSLTGETSSYTPLQAEREISVATENGEVKLSIPDGAQAKLAGVNFSEGKNDGVDAKTLGDTLRKYFFSPEKFNKLVSIYPTAEAIPADVRAAAAADAHMSEKDVPWEHVQGFAMNGKVYLVAGNIKEGNELAVFLHELGVHVGMERLIGTANMKRLSAQIETWAARNDKSQETQFAKDAVRRAADSASEDQQQEVIAYFVEEAVKAGINPVAVQKTNSPLAQWFRSLWAAAKLALRKIGFGRFDQLTAQNIVDLSYGAAKMELTGTWHGTAADFRNFNHSYMGSGEGAQAFGWGTYLAQRVGIAKGYFEADIGRKTTGGVFRSASGFPITEGELQRDLNGMVRAGRDLDADALASLQRNYKETLAKWEGKVELKRDYDRLQYSLTELEDAIADGGITYQPRTQPEGSLMRVDTAVHDDEMLDWDKPLSEQNKVRIALMPLRKFLAHTADELSGGANWNDLTGEEMYRLVQRALQQDYFDPNLPGVDEALLQGKTDKAASEYLDSIGIKGIKFLDSQSRSGNAAKAYDNYPRAFQFNDAIKANDMLGFDSRGEVRNMLKQDGLSEAQKNFDMSPELVAEAKAWLEWLAKPVGETRNLVIFNDKNIQRVASQVGANRDKVKFSQADVTKTNPQYRQASTLVKQLIEYAGNKLQSLENNLMFGHQLGEKLQRLMPGTASYIKSVQNRQTERVKHEQEIARIANLYNELDTKQQNALNSFVQKSTMDGKWGFKPTWFEKDVQTEVDATAKTQFDALSPEAQQVAKDMFKFGSEQQKRFDESVNANIDDPKQKVQRNQMYGKPYAPLKRFGDHVVVGKSAQFLAEEKENPGGKRLEEMKADENHYYVEFTDGNLEAIQRRDKMAEANPNLAWESKPLQLEAKALNSVNFTVLEKLKKQIEASDNKSTEATKGALKSLANQLYIQQLNQLHANKSQAQRLNVKGADTDMMRAFVTQGRAEAALIANLRTHAETEAALQQIQKAAREGGNQDTKTRIANAVLRRHLAMLDFKPTPIQNKLMGLNSFYMLLTSPAYYLTNSTQPFVVTLPYMAGRFGGANSWNTLRDAYKTTLELVKLSTLFKDQNLDTTHLKKFDSVGRESEALQTLLDENLVNVGMEMELGDIANQSKNPTWKHVQKGMQVLKTGVANVEILNRLSSAVAGYRLAYTEAVNNKLSPEDAHNAGVEYARKVIIDTHGDYAGYNAPTVMMQGAFGNLPVKLMTQFKKFQFIQAGLLIGTFRDAYMRGNLNNNEKAAARAMFKWMLGTQAALAGALGGVTGIPMAILGSMAAGAFGDDGEDKEAYLRRILGGGAFAQLILHGAPAAAGVDISKRVGMGAALDPFRMADPQTDWSDYALSIAGPSAGLASRFGSGMSYLGKGQYWKGLEMMMPSGVITNASKVARYESEGLTNSRGDVVMKPEEVSLMTDLMQSLGLETTQLSDRRWKAEAVYDRGVHFKEKTSQLQRDYVEAVKDQDQSALNEIRKGWMELQAERVKQGFKRENMSTLTHAPMAQKKRERDTVHGLQSTATNKKFVQSIDGL